MRGSQMNWVWENRKEIAKAIGEVIRWVWPKSKPKATEPAAHVPGIAIMGAGGVGKTTLARILSGEFNYILDAAGDYDETLGVEEFRLKDAPEVGMIVPPGQEHR